MSLPPSGPSGLARHDQPYPRPVVSLPVLAVSLGLWWLIVEAAGRLLT